MRNKTDEIPAATWLHLIENDNIRTRAIANLGKFPAEPCTKCSKINDALFHAFKWEKSSEGEFYWLDVYNSTIALKAEAKGQYMHKSTFDLYKLAIAAGVISLVSFLLFKCI